MKWDESYADNSIEFIYDKYCRKVKKNDMVLWASKDTHNVPYILEGKVLGFANSPSFTKIYLLTFKNRLVVKNGSNNICKQIIKIL